MTTLVLDPWVERRLRAEREKSPSAQFDEVWSGTYILRAPLDNEHQAVTTALATVCQIVVDWAGLGAVRAHTYLSDREEEWLQNYRNPDVSVVLAGNRGKNCASHWCGSTDCVAETISPNDYSREKLPFYEKLSVREVLLIDRDPWALELYRLKNKKLRLIGKSTLKNPLWLESTVLPLQFRLVPGQARPHIEITHTDGVQRWLV